MTFNKKIQFITLAFFLLFSVAAATQITEYNAKAAFLERFTRFVEWPEDSTVLDITKPFILGVIGKNPFDSILDEIYASQEIKSKKVEIRYISDLSEIPKCHLLFIPKSKKKELTEILNVTKDKPILTISDTKGFAESGVLINLYFENNKTRFEINEDAVKKSGLSMSYHLLGVAKLVKPKEINNE